MVFFYFLVTLLLVYKGLYYFFKQRSISKTAIWRSIMYSVLLAIVILAAGYSFFIEEYRPIHIVVTALGDSGKTHVDQKGTEVWINQIVVNDEVYDLSQVTLSKGWEYREGALLSYQNQPNTIEIDLLSAEKVEIFFASHPWSGEVAVNDGVRTQTIDLYSSGAGELNTLELLGTPKETNFQDAAIVFGSFLMISATAFFLISWMLQTKSALSIVAALLLLYFFVSSLFEILTLTRIVVLLATIVCGVVLSYYLKSMRVDKAPGKLYKVMLVLVTLYTTFAIVGHQLFMAGDIMTFTLTDAAKFLLVFIFTLPFICSILFLLEKANHYFYSKDIAVEQKQRKHVRWISFVIVFSILIFTALSCYPANITSDGIDQWAQAKGLAPLSNAHPFFHTLLLRACSTVWDNPFFVVILQIAAFAFLLSSFLTMFFERGLNKYIAFTISALLALLPNNLLMLTLMSKNIPFALSVWWLMYLLIRLFEDPYKFFHKPVNYIQLILSISLIDLIRHNGFLAVYSILIMLAFVSIKYRKQIKGLAFIVIVGVIVLLQIVKGPVATVLSVGEHTFVASSQLISPLGAAIKTNTSLPNEVLSTMERVAPLKQWEETYAKYNSDLFYWSQPRPNFQSVSTKEAFAIYLKILFSRPDIIIKDRLDHIDLIWNVSRPYDNGYGTYVVGMWAFSGAEDLLPELLHTEDLQDGKYYKNNFLTKPLNLGLTLSNNSILETVIWRNGAYIVLYFVLLLFSIGRRQYKTFLISIPALATLITLILVMGWQIYQYIWFFPFSVIVLMLHAMTTPAGEQ